jgi:RNA recognition motif-containing protein
MFPTTPTLTTSPSLMVLPHPYAGHNLFLTHIHPHVTESQLLNFFGKYGPFTSTSYGWVPPSERLQPDVHYESMFWRSKYLFI